MEKTVLGKRQSGTARAGQLPTPATPKGRPWSQLPLGGGFLSEVMYLLNKILI